MIRRFAHHSVYIAALHAPEPLLQRARFALQTSDDVRFISSHLMHLLLLPNLSDEDDRLFISFLLRRASPSVPVSDQLVDEILEIAESYRLNTWDALQLAIAIRGHAQEIVTARHSDNDPLAERSPIPVRSLR